MSNLSFRQNVALWPILLILFLQLLYVLPIFGSFSDLSLFNFIEDNGHNSLLRTILFTIITTFFQIAFGFFGALLLYRIKSTKIQIFFVLFLLPALIGNVTIASLLNKMPWFPSWLESRPFLGTLTVLGLIQLWQYGFLFLYLFWFRLQFIDEKFENFLKSNNFSFSERVSHLFWPQSKNLGVLLAIFGVIFNFYEQSKISIFLKSSGALNTEFISHWISKIYQQNQGVNASFAAKTVLGYSGILIIPTFVLSFIFILTILRGGNFVTKKVSIFNFNFLEKTPKFLIYIFLSLSILSIIIPLTFTLKNLFPFYQASLKIYFENILYILPTSLFITFFVILSGIILRLNFPRLLQRFSVQSMPLFLILFIFRMIPPTGLSFCGLELHRLFLGKLSMIIFWFISQAILIFPFLIIFVLFIHFEVKENEIKFLQQLRTKFNEIIGLLFRRRFFLHYIFLFLFAWAFTWNEDTVTEVLFFKFNSVNILLKTKNMGKGLSMNESSSLILPNLIITVLILILWGFLTNKYISRGKDNR